MPTHFSGFTPARLIMSLMRCAVVICRRPVGYLLEPSLRKGILELDFLAFLQQCPPHRRHWSLKLVSCQKKTQSRAWRMAVSRCIRPRCGDARAVAAWRMAVSWCIRPRCGDACAVAAWRMAVSQCTRPRCGNACAVASWHMAVSRCTRPRCGDACAVAAWRMAVSRCIQPRLN